MSDQVTARLQQKRGLRRQLPQPLPPAEFGFCTDTGQLFIGSEETLILTIELFTGELGSEAIANGYLDNQIVLINLVEYNTNFVNPEQTILLSAQYVLFTEPYTNGFGQTNYTRAYVGYTSPQIGLPGFGLGSEFFMGALIQFTDGTTNDLANVIPGAIVEDSAAVASLLNVIYNDGGIATGLATVSQNIEIFTETSVAIAVPTIPLNRVDIPLDVSPSGVLIFSSSFDTADAYFVQYSLNNLAGDYSRTGTIRITNNPGAIGDLAEITDEYVESANSPTTLYFEGRLTPSGPSYIVSLVARNNDIVDLVMTYKLDSWKTGVGLT